MRWRGGRQSSNINDSRGSSGKKLAFGGGIGAIIIVIISLVTGKDLSQVKLIIGKSKTFRQSDYISDFNSAIYKVY